jgi:acetyl/propionyl-CoA carboxylase alpha subunit
MIARLLIANRGEIARRIARAAHGLGVQTVAVYSDADAASPYVTECDLAVRLPGTAAADTYLDVAAVVAAARRAGADAVHPGYGFLAENADAAQAVLDAGLVWVGPSPAAMRAMASKVASKALVAEAGVPVLPSALLDSDDPADWQQAAAALGLPLLVKASAGGGGRGMRVVASADDLVPAVQAARREAQAAFGDPTVYAERLVQRGRHVEIQVVGDGHGTLLHLFERECSLQRRHQKILEESPSPGAHPEVVQRMAQAAVDAARAVGYTSLGTVEFLLEDDGAAGGGALEPDPQAPFWFLEMNTRLQVEHPVTEAVTGLDLVAWQLRLAAGMPLGLTQDDVTRSGHAVEARLVAEDPATGWVPSSGQVLRFEPPEVPGVRWDTGVRTGSVVPAHYDSLVAKVIAHGVDRGEAFDRLAAALRGLRVVGVATNRDALLALLADPDVRAGRTTTDLVEDRADSWLAGPPQHVLDLHAALAGLAVHTAPAAAAPPLAPTGWRSLAPAVTSLTLVRGGEPTPVTVRSGRDTTTVQVGDSEPQAVLVHGWDGEHLDVELDGLRQQAAVLLGAEHDEAGRGVHVFAVGWSSDWVEPARLPAGDRAEQARGPSSPVPGTVVAVHVAPGDAVTTGQALIVLEAMKMEHRITADADGTVLEVAVAVGDAVDAHEVLVVLEPVVVEEVVHA